jgi:hypothetical protein
VESIGVFELGERPVPGAVAPGIETAPAAPDAEA